MIASPITDRHPLHLSRTTIPRASSSPKIRSPGGTDLVSSHEQGCCIERAEGNAYFVDQIHTVRSGAYWASNVAMFSCAGTETPTE